MELAGPCEQAAPRLKVNAETVWILTHSGLSLGPFSGPSAVLRPSARGGGRLLRGLGEASGLARARGLGPKVGGDVARWGDAGDGGFFVRAQIERVGWYQGNHQKSGCLNGGAISSMSRR